MMNIQYHTLSNGLRLVHVPTASQVSWCGLAINAGSRDEREGHYGLAHFVEHTIFKGTRHRRAWHILNRMERVGGELNAYTTKEGTMLYSVFPSQHLERAVDLLADLVQWSQFPQEELDRERDVVLEEAASYRDTPSEAVYDDFEDLLFAGSELGHNILGRKEDLENLTRDDCMNYLKTLYVPDNMVFFSVGPERPERVFRLAEKHFGGMSHAVASRRRCVPQETAPFRQVVQIGTHQAHTVIGARVVDMNHPLRHAMMLLNNILGGPGMNSLLNVELRERRGYVYTVESTLTLLSDCGWMEIYLGCDPDDVRSSLKVISRITGRLMSEMLPSRRLDAYKKQYCGQLVVAADNTEFMAMRAGRGMLYHGKVATIDETIAGIQAVTPEEIAQAAAFLRAERLSSLTFQ
ncbi:MAG: insulinase family protein [Muribaculaceae bacterium]|nr:insulinase family protein [Muribaculaceae bacterium]